MNIPQTELSTIDAGLAYLDSVIANNPGAQPRTSVELAEMIEQAIASGITNVSGTRVYVPDVEAPTTPDVKEDQVLGPLPFVETETRVLSNQAKTLNQQLLSLVNEVTRTKAGLQTILTNTKAAVSSIGLTLNSPNSGWLSVSDTFLDLSNIDQSNSSNVYIDVNSHSGVTLSPSTEQDLTPQIVNVSLLTAQSQGGIPGDNIEIVSLQDLPSTESPQAGSTQALTQQRQTASFGGSGLEPTVTFASDSDSHNSLASILNDQVEEYFDWERIFVPPQQHCSLHGTAYVYDPTGGSLVNVPQVTQNYGWTATITAEDGVTQTNTSLVQFIQNPPRPGADGQITLNLSLSFDLGIPTPMNQVEVTVRRVQGLWPIVTSVSASADNTKWFQLRTQNGATSWTGDSSSMITISTSSSNGGSSIVGTGQSVLGTSVWEVPTLGTIDQASNNGGFPLVRYINITLQQPDAYPCPKGIGHPYYVEVVEDNKSSSSWFGLSHSHSDTTAVQRLPNPNAIISVQPGVISSTSSNPGAVVGKDLGTVAGIAGALTGGTLGALNKGLSLVGLNLAGIGQALGSLWGSNSETRTVQQAGEYTDVFQGYRQVISLRRIKPLSRQFPTGVNGQIQTTSITFNHQISAVRLFSDQLVPSNTTLTWEISFDQGNTWQTITPMTLGVAPAPYTMSSTSVVQPTSPAQSVCLRATLQTSSSQSTPRIMGYQLQALPFLG